MTNATFASARQRYATSAVSTASPARLLVMLYERLLRDLASAEQALGDRDHAKANDQLQHAQQIVLELRTSLDVTKWSGGPGLAALYTYLHGELVSANLEKNAERVATCREILEPLHAAWELAVRSTGSPAA
jgi:flagellar protein FliS